MSFRQVTNSHGDEFALDLGLGAEVEAVDLYQTSGTSPPAGTLSLNSGSEPLIYESATECEFDADAWYEMKMRCEVECLGKIHHGSEESAADHVQDLGGSAYFYECDSQCEWTDEHGNDRTAQHWHVAGSTIPRRMRKWVES